MLYLAEVQKHHYWIGSRATVLKLQAYCQERSRQIWRTVQDEVVIATQVKHINKGMLVLIEVTSDRQVCQVYSTTAGPIVNILQAFTYLEKQWTTYTQSWEDLKLSLLLQQQELNRHETRIQELEEKLQQALARRARRRYK